MSLLRDGAGALRLPSRSAVLTFVKWVWLHVWIVPIVVGAIWISALKHEMASLREKTEAAGTTGAVSSDAVANLHLQVANGLHEASVARSEQASQFQLYVKLAGELDALKKKSAATDAALIALSASSADLAARAAKGDPTVSAELEARLRRLGLSPLPVRP